MAERFGVVPLTPYPGGDFQVSAPPSAIFVSAKVVAVVGGGNVLFYRYQVEDELEPARRFFLRSFVVNEIVPDEYFPIADPVLIDAHGTFWFICRRQGQVQ